MRPLPGTHLRTHLRSQGAALLTAMLIVMLVASLATAALWQQWRSVEIESAERQRSQLAWILNGALDWSRLILQEDLRSNSNVDHLSEPWALPLAEARLSSFLAMDKNNTDTTTDAFLSGQIDDQQALLNLSNLVEDGRRSEASVKQFARLFTALHLPRSELNALVDAMVQASLARTALKNQANTAQGLGAGSANLANPTLPAASAAPLRPDRVEQLVWLGVAPTTLQALRPYVTLLPERTPVNLNTAPAVVLYAVLPAIDAPQAQQMVSQRSTAHFPTVTDALKAVGLSTDLIEASSVSVASRYFSIRGRLRLGDTTVQERSLVERQGNSVKVLWRQREVVSPETTAPTQPPSLQ